MRALSAPLLRARCASLLAVAIRAVERGEFYAEREACAPTEASDGRELGRAAAT